MAANDAAFMWETEALRSSVIATGKHERAPAERGEGWLTLRETESATGIPVSTLRKWVRKEAVPSFLDESGEDPIRMLWLKGVTQRAEVLGRDLPTKDDDTDPEPVAVEIDADIRTVAPTIDLHDDLETVSNKVAPGPSDQPEPDSPPPGTMVVPIEAWDKMLIQLGNLHQAGQQLAEARERAGKAETEAKFLRERLGELRDEQAEGDQQQSTPSPPEPAPRGRVSIEIDDGQDPDVEGTILDEDVASESEDSMDGTSLSTYSIEVVKHLYSTWRDRPRRGL